MTCKCGARATHNIRCGDGVILVQPFSNADGTRSELVLCERHAEKLVKKYTANGLNWTTERILEGRDGA